MMGVLATLKKEDGTDVERILRRGAALDLRLTWCNAVDTNTWD